MAFDLSAVAMPAPSAENVVVATGEDPGAIAAEWDALADRVVAAPWLRPGWILAWQRAFGRGRLEAVVARRGGRLAGVLALQRRRGALSSPTNWHTPSFGVLAEDDAVRDALVGELWRGRPRSVALHLLDAGSGDAEAVARSARRAGYRVVDRVELRSPFVPTTGAFDEHLRSQREGRKLAKELRRQRRRLEREGPVRLRIEDGASRLDEVVADGFRLEGSQWKTDNGTAIVSRPDTHRFYDEVARWAAERGSLRFAFLDVGDKPVAFDFLLEEAGAWHNLKGGYDDAYRPTGPGKILTQEILTTAFAGPIGSLELLGTDDPYKLQWTDQVRERVLVHAFAPTLAGRVEALVQTRGRAAAKRALAAVARLRAQVRRRQASSATSADSSS